MKTVATSKGLMIEKNGQRIFGISACKSYRHTYKIQSNKHFINFCT